MLTHCGVQIHPSSLKSKNKIFLLFFFTQEKKIKKKPSRLVGQVGELANVRETKLFEKIRKASLTGQRIGLITWLSRDALNTIFCCFVIRLKPDGLFWHFNLFSYHHHNNNIKLMAPNVMFFSPKISPTEAPKKKKASKSNLASDASSD